jgi:hypothetical protein
VSSLTFRSLDLHSAEGPNDVGIRLQITVGFLARPETRGEDYIVAARVGRSSGDRISDTLKLVLEGTVRGSTVEEWRTYTDLLWAVLDENGAEPGELEAGEGYLGLASGQTATINARVRNVIPGPIRAGGMLQSWSIELESIDPAWSVA